MKENSEFKPAKLRLKSDLVSYPARNMYIQWHILIYTQIYTYAIVSLLFFYKDWFGIKSPGKVDVPWNKETEIEIDSKIQERVLVKKYQNVFEKSLVYVCIRQTVVA